MTTGISFCRDRERDDLANKAVQDFKALVSEPHVVKDPEDTYLIIVGDAKKTPSQIRWQRDVREKLTKPEEYYTKKRARDDRHRVNRKKKKIEATVKSPARCNKNTDHIHPQLGGGLNSPSMHRHLAATGQISPCRCCDCESERNYRDRVRQEEFAQSLDGQS